MKTIIVTRHNSLVDYLREIGLIGDGFEIVAHATPEIVKDNIVIGVLPHHLSCLTHFYIEIPINIPAELRGIELSLEQIRKFASSPCAYVVTKREYKF